MTRQQNVEWNSHVKEMYILLSNHQMNGLGETIYCHLLDRIGIEEQLNIQE
jgi:hypothetical protein